MNNHSNNVIPEWLLRHLPYNHYTIDVGKKNMHVMEKGNGKPIILVHGNPMWGYLYKKVLDQLDNTSARLIVPDLIGFGFSDKIKIGEHSLEAHTEWMSNFFKTIKEDSIGLVIHDWGGMIGVAGAMRAGKKINGLVVMNTSVTAPKDGFNPTWFHNLSQMPIISDLLFRIFNFPQAYLGLFQGIPNSYSKEDLRSYKYPLRKFTDNIGPLALARMVPNNMSHPSVAIEKEVEEFLRSYKGPAEIVWGMNDSVMWKLRRRTERLFPQAKTVKTDAGHFVQQESPEKVVESMKKIFKLTNN
ncbi:MAG: alpha/beta fold hydrolase [Candidatus Marinimicrobia bacterium]|jgi:haloalkane dehalogenase|nr:alpha/beta fold hydrolase [Gammaproteobacteria bacterium]MBL6911657.1 alpha/beta fold hydrolase [Candidatus Neomarinimicrobiota bacterium]MBT3728349.1 alpha/beta fold hydrolase [Candidatus Neomarinimicrobiota bacterium]MBT3944391.1 alpha/beta fold hydrolase [Candidatus Neomarinimicrobiota bacterium]MBT4112184.1 alpha/beta fold hydrolase [Candidatus Neomarinimicrobiota bacterium]